GGKTVRQEYTDHGQLARMTDTAGLTTFYSYNPDGTLRSAVQHERDDSDSPVTAQVLYTYDGLGRITRTDRGNGVTTEIQYTDAHQIRHEKTARNGKLLTEASYRYDSHSNLTQRTDTRPKAGPNGTPGPAVTTTTQYTYDAYNRLIGSQVLGGGGEPLHTTGYTLNVSGDVVATATTTHTGEHAGQARATEHHIDPSGRLSTLTTTVDGEPSTQRKQTFDDEGSLRTGHDGTTWTYNLRRQPTLVTSPDGTTTSYTYWADGTRATATQTTPADGQKRTALFHYTPTGTLINDTHTITSSGTQTETGVPAAADTSTASYLLAGTRHARALTGPGADAAAATGAGYLITDRHGSTTALTNSSGELNQAWQYTDYGQHADYTGTPLPTGSRQPPGLPEAARQPFTYAGEHTAPDGTQYLRTRLYDPATGRFTTPDPAPQFNRYQAMGTNPITSIDPAGTSEIPDWANWLVTALSGFLTIISAVATAVSFGIAAPVTLAGTVLGGAALALDLASTAAESLRMSQPVVAGLKKAALAFALADLPAGAVAGILTGARLAGKMGMTGAVRTVSRITDMNPSFFNNLTGNLNYRQLGDMKHIARMHHQTYWTTEGNVCAVATLNCLENLRKAPGDKISVSATESMRWISHSRMKQLSGTASEWSGPMNSTQLAALYAAKTTPSDPYRMHIIGVRTAHIPQPVYALAGDVPSHYFLTVTSKNQEGAANWSSYALDINGMSRISQDNLDELNALEFRVLDVGSAHPGWFKIRPDGFEELKAVFI
ncbi:RHS repeat-associated core domain-containing protein, partial [Streptomyces sp. NPDC096030]|uniref:RHS repeat protein n=1 Tax=Streptomyces sp. NPDC096030 TaxID=3155423 RepID=UPI003323C71A